MPPASDIKDPTEQMKNGNILQFVKDYWFIVVFIVGFAMAWSTLLADVKAAAIVNETQQDQIEATAAAHNALDRKYIEDITFIKTKLTELSPKR